MNDTIQLRTPITLSGEDIEKALFEQAKEVPSVSRASGHLRGSVAKRAADELNQVLDLDIYELFARAWTTVPRVRNAVQFSALRLGTVKVSEMTSAPPAVIKLDEHTIVSTSYPVLSIDVPHDALPELRLTLKIAAQISNAKLTFHDGRIEVLALGDASMHARVSYKDVLLKEHVTDVQGAPRDPLMDQPAATAPGVDFHV
jgi:hypothetical protein